jgi:4-hydroxybenzoate polyprenyltransferase
LYFELTFGLIIAIIKANFSQVMLDYLKLLRPLQWIKNIFIFVPLVFARELFVSEKLVTTLTAFVVFCFVASSMYIINDLLDKEQDALHPTKRFRPLAAGTVSIFRASTLVLILLSSSALVVYYYIPQIAIILGIYIILNILYSGYLKNIVVVDIVIVSVFYLCRILVGGFATDTYISRWLVLCTIFLTLFIIVGKRRSEQIHHHQRKVLQFYTPQLLDLFLAITTALTLVAYGIYSVLGVTSEHAVYSMLFVLVGVFRYLYLIYSSSQAEYPEKIAVTDKVIIMSVVGWGIGMYYIFYLT